MANNKLDVEIVVDVTEKEELQASGTVKGSKFLGTMTKGALKLVSKEIGNAIANVLTEKKENKDIDEVVEESITEEETLV